MSKYNVFLAIFIVSIISGIFFFVFYVQAISIFMLHAGDYFGHDQFKHFPVKMFREIFTPPLILSIIFFGASSLAVKVLGIVYAAKNKIIPSGEKALWIMGFVLMGFITSIIFLVLAKDRKLVE